MKKIIVAVICCLAFTGLFAQGKAGKVDTMKHATFYSCPMHHDMTSMTPGKCPKCGMSLALNAKEKMKAGVIKSYTCPVHLDVVSHDPANCPKCGRKLNLSPKEQMKAEAVKLYTCPMHPEVSLTKDGTCPKCGKALTEKKTG